LDLDETLVHCSTEPVPNPDMKFTVRANGIPYDIYVKVRPFFYHFMKKVHKKFEVVVFTASQRVYAERLLDLLDPKRQYIRHRLYRETCVNVNGNYLKDLSILGRDLNKVVIVDNSPQAFGYQPSNGIPIESWFDDEKDVELVKLGNFLMELREVDDVRTVVKKRFHTEDLIREYYG
jgi:CTD small phosphatase-like protein 2